MRHVVRAPTWRTASATPGCTSTGNERRPGTPCRNSSSRTAPPGRCSRGAVELSQKGTLAMSLKVTADGRPFWACDACNKPITEYGLAYGVFTLRSDRSDHLQTDRKSVV